MFRNISIILLLSLLPLCMQIAGDDPSGVIGVGGNKNAIGGYYGGQSDETGGLGSYIDAEEGALPSQEIPPAAAIEKIALVYLDASGNEYLVSQPPFTTLNEDGTFSMTTDLTLPNILLKIYYTDTTSLRSIIPFEPESDGTIYTEPVSLLSNKISIIFQKLVKQGSRAQDIDTNFLKDRLTHPKLFTYYPTIEPTSSQLDDYLATILNQAQSYLLKCVSDPVLVTEPIADPEIWYKGVYTALKQSYKQQAIDYFTFRDDPYALSLMQDYYCRNHAGIFRNYGIDPISYVRIHSTMLGFIYQVYSHYIGSSDTAAMRTAAHFLKAHLLLQKYQYITQASTMLLSSKLGVTDNSVHEELNQAWLDLQTQMMNSTNFYQPEPHAFQLPIQTYQQTMITILGTMADSFNHSVLSYASNHGYTDVEYQLLSTSERINAAFTALQSFRDTLTAGLQDMSAYPEPPDFSALPTYLEAVETLSTEPIKDYFEATRQSMLSGELADALHITEALQTASPELYTMRITLAQCLIFLMDQWIE